MPISDVQPCSGGRGRCAPFPCRIGARSSRRNDSADRFMVALAQLAFDLALPTENSGPTAFVAPDREEVWVRRLFEKAVLGFARVDLEPLGWSVRGGVHLEWQVSSASEGLAAILPRMETDIVLDPPNGGRRVVVDTKFSSILASGRFGDASRLKSGYLYQMYAYVRSQDGRESRWDFCTLRLTGRFTSEQLSRTTRLRLRQSTSPARLQPSGPSLGGCFAANSNGSDKRLLIDRFLKAQSSTQKVDKGVTIYFPKSALILKPLSDPIVCMSKTMCLYVIKECSITSLSPRKMQQTYIFDVPTNSNHTEECFTREDQNRPLRTEHLLKAKKMDNVFVHYGRSWDHQTSNSQPTCANRRKLHSNPFQTQIFPAIYMKSLEDHQSSAFSRQPTSEAVQVY